MPWKEVNLMSLRNEFIALAAVEGCNFSQLCSRFGISRKTGYKWVKRFIDRGVAGLVDRPRRPKSSPWRTPFSVEEAILGVREKHPVWGGRKIASRLKALGMEGIPAPSTITVILQRHGCIDPEESVKHKPWQRFEAEAPNELWQMDFKGHFETSEGRCHPLTVLDDHSRYALCLQACSDEGGATVQRHLTSVFQRYGMPIRILADNGSPWGTDGEHPYTILSVWLMRLGIMVSHSRPSHPQTLGKEERFHKTLKAELLKYCTGMALQECQERFETWREVYNCERPHESLEMQVPAARYQVSARSFPEVLPSIEYGPNDYVRKVQQDGKISYHNREYRISKAFRRQYVALRPTTFDDVFDVFFCNQKISQLDLRNHN